MTHETYSIANGKTLHRWTAPNGDMWACAEYDHGPLCRRCVPVNPTTDACLQNVADGLFEIVGQTPSEDFTLRLTVEGERRAEHLIYGAADNKDSA